MKTSTIDFLMRLIRFLADDLHDLRSEKFSVSQFSRKTGNKYACASACMCACMHVSMHVWVNVGVGGCDKHFVVSIWYENLDPVMSHGIT